MRLTEEKIITELSELYEDAKPLSISITSDREVGSIYQRYDIIAELKVENNISRYVAIEVVSVPTPKNLQNKTILIKQKEKGSSTPITVIIVAPYIGLKQGKMLDEDGVCWMDLCGNMKIEIKEGENVRLYVEKTGNRNRFPDSSPIKKIFQGTSSLVSRALLLKPEGFESQYKLADFINKRKGSITVSTVSRVVKSLEGELLVNREKSVISVKDAAGILDELLMGFRASSWRKGRKVFRFSSQEFEQRCDSIFEPNVDYVACGFYAAKLKGLAVTNEVELCVRNIVKFKDECSKKLVPMEPDEEYGNVKVIEADDPGVRFNSSGSPVRVDDIELYLEMMNNKPRGPKVAGMLKDRILEGFRK